MQPSSRVHRRASVLSSSLLLKPFPACLFRLIWIFCVLGGKSPHRYYFIGSCFQYMFKTTWVSLNKYRLALTPSVSLKCNWCKVTIVLTSLQFGRITILLNQRSSFHKVNNLSIAAIVLPMGMLISLSFDDILLPRYMNRFANFRGLSFNEEIGHGADYTDGLELFVKAESFLHSLEQGARCIALYANSDKTELIHIYVTWPSSSTKKTPPSIHCRN